LIETVENNLNCLLLVLEFNAEHGIYFFRITSDLVPLATHRVCTFNWQRFFKKDFGRLGGFIGNHNMRISMHPGQYTLINSPDKNIFRRGLADLKYHNQVLDLLGLDNTAKIQIHVGGVYGNKERSIKRFISRYKKLPRSLKRRLVIENDEKLFSLNDCMRIYSETGVPVLFDVFHHQLNNNGEDIIKAFDMFVSTWTDEDGLPMVDYSEQMKGARPGAHADLISTRRFAKFLKETEQHDFDVMLEIKDKEASAIKAVKTAAKDRRMMGLY